jgi:hypothetical protein
MYRPNGDRSTLERPLVGPNLIHAPSDLGSEAGVHHDECIDESIVVVVESLSNPEKSPTSALAAASASFAIVCALGAATPMPDWPLA